MTKCLSSVEVFFFQAEDGIRDLVRSRGLGDVYKRQVLLAHITINGQIGGQADRNNYLQTNIAELDKQVAEIRELQTRRNQLIDRMQVIQNLQGTRCLLYTSPSPRDRTRSRMPSSA